VHIRDEGTHSSETEQSQLSQESLNARKKQKNRRGPPQMGKESQKEQKIAGAANSIIFETNSGVE
jgi:hypothetical protein